MWRWIGVVMMMRMRRRVGSDGMFGRRGKIKKKKKKKKCNFNRKNKIPRSLLMSVLLV